MLEGNELRVLDLMNPFLFQHSHTLDFLYNQQIRLRIYYNHPHNQINKLLKLPIDIASFLNKLFFLKLSQFRSQPVDLDSRELLRGVLLLSGSDLK